MVARNGVRGPAVAYPVTLSASDAVKAEGTSRATWEITQVADSCRLLAIHDRLCPDANNEIYGGWPMIFSGPQDTAGDR